MTVDEAVDIEQLAVEVNINSFLSDNQLTKSEK